MYKDKYENGRALAFIKTKYENIASLFIIILHRSLYVKDFLFNVGTFHLALMRIQCFHFVISGKPEVNP